MGTEAFWVPALIAGLGTAAQGANQMAATSRANTEETQAIDNQQQVRQQANDQTNQLTKAIASNSPTAMANKEQGDFVANLRQNLSGRGSSTKTLFGAPTSALAPTPGASSRFNTDTANANTQTQNYGNTYAGEESAIDSAVRQRQNEGLAMNTLGTKLNLLGAQSASQGFVDQLRARSAGQTNPWVDMLGKGAAGAGQGMARNSWFVPNTEGNPDPLGGA